MLSQTPASHKQSCVTVFTPDVMREVRRAYDEKRIRTSCSLTVFKKPDVSMTGESLHISAGNGRIFGCVIANGGAISLQIGGKAEASLTVKGGFIGSSDNSIWIQITLAKSKDDFWLEINIPEPTLRQIHARTKNAAD